MFDFKDLKQAKERTAPINTKREQEAEKAFNDAVELMNKLSQSKDFDLKLLRKAADKLVLSIKNKRNKAEPYIYLSNIFYILDDVPAAIEYMKIAQSINPDLPEISRLQNLIS